ncbi:hypothetical protein E2493_05215 [Sphingomonas parva]|uniref:DUF4350 domain-containing protein n=1 Tax=Sphingomonas parva TaxID=2555898 RepID=A0A4Y8ZTK5_9SPHN|nr:hypothetical protein [Sphingomonas parva]TFI59244.1 hypothetical protein E2493_05215 [Sphingomonas parva]
MSESARPTFEPKVVAAVIAAGIVAFGLFLVLAAYAGDTGSSRDGRAHALSSSGIGFKGIVRLIELSGGQTRLVRNAGDFEGEDLLVIAAEPDTSAEAIEEVVRLRGGRATLIVLPKWGVVPDRDKRGWVRGVGTLPDGLVSEILGKDRRLKVTQSQAKSRTARGRDFLAGVQAPLPRIVQTVSGYDVTPLLVGAPGEIVLARLGDAPLYLLADPDLLNNQGLKEPARAKAALAILTELNATDARAVAFDLTVNGFGRHPNALQLAFEPPFLPLTLALVLAAILGGLHGAFRFGPAAEEPRAIAFGKTALVENSAGLLKIARREHRAGDAYAQLIREAAAHESGAHLALRDTELDAYLDRLSPPGEPRFSALAAAARQAGDRAGLVAAARALFQWKKDLIK